MTFAKLALATTLALSSSLAHAEEHTLGQQGSVVVAADLAALIDHTKVERGDQGRSVLTFGLHPSLDYFVADRVSLGGDLTFISQKISFDPTGQESRRTALGAGVRAGYLAPLRPQLSLWLRGGVGYRSDEFDAPFEQPSSESTTVIVDARAMALYEPVAHLFLAAGPGFTYESTDDAPAADETSTSFGLRLEIGGYW